MSGTPLQALTTITLPCPTCGAEFFTATERSTHHLEHHERPLLTVSPWVAVAIEEGRRQEGAWQ